MSSAQNTASLLVDVVFALSCVLMNLTWFGILMFHFLSWLVTGYWPTLSVGDFLNSIGVSAPVSSWLGVQEISDGVMNYIPSVRFCLELELQADSL